MDCVCCSGRRMDECCGPLLDGSAAAPSPEALMRSRYAAFVHKNFDYILATTDPQRRYDFDHDANRAWMNSSIFTGLEILASTENGNKGTVEFIARYRRDGGPEKKHHELSRFRKQAGIWYFRDGKTVG